MKTKAKDLQGLTRRKMEAVLMMDFDRFPLPTATDSHSEARALRMRRYKIETTVSRYLFLVEHYKRKKI